MSDNPIGQHPIPEEVVTGFTICNLYWLFLIFGALNLRQIAPFIEPSDVEVSCARGDRDSTK